MNAGSSAAVSSTAPDCPVPARRRSSHASSPSRGGRDAADRRRTTTCSTSLGPASMASSTIDEEVDVLALAVGDVRRQDEARAARPDPLAQRAGPEAGEDDAVDRPDPDGRQHRDDRLGRCRHVDRQAVALADPEAAKPGGDPLDLGEQLRIREGAPSTPLVERDQGRRLATTRRDVAIERVRGEVRPAAREPGEARPRRAARRRVPAGGSTRAARPAPARTSPGR